MKRNLLISMLVMLVMLVGVFTVGTVAASAADDAATEVDTFAQLVAAVNEDKTNIKLTADIVHEVPMELPEQHRLVFDGNREYVLDLNGYSLNVQNLDNEYYAGSISFIKVMGTSKVTIKNGYIAFGNDVAKDRESCSLPPPYRRS